MAKESLRFKIAGRNIVYEGNPDTRPKDLMDILAKLGVAEDTVVGTFRENIENESEFTDDDINKMFSSAVKARAEKKAKQANKGDAPSPASPNTTAEAEQPQKITLVCKGKQFSYEGLPSSKRNAVIQLVTKQKDMTEELAIETFRANLPDEQISDADIWKLVQDTKAAKSARRSSASAASGQQHADPSAAAASGSAANTEAVHELFNMSSKDREDINNFIKQVLEQPPTDVAALLREQPKASGRRIEDDNPELILTARTSGKIAVYCQEENTSGQKVIYVTPTMSFEEFASTVEKKFGRAMHMSFYEDEDVIELDDDDVLAMFLEMSQRQTDGKKMKLICSSGPRQTVQHDAITEELASATVAAAPGQVQTNAAKVKAYSSGELDVKELCTYSGHSLAVYCCAFAPKGDQFVTGSRDRSVRLWNTKNRSCTQMKGGHNGFVLSCDFSPKGNRVVSSSEDGTIKVWNTLTCAKISTLKGHENKVYCVQYNPTGEYIVSGSCDHTVKVWNAETFSKVSSLKGHTLAVFSCAFSRADGGKRVVSGSDDRLIKIWDWKNAKEIRSLIGHVGTVWSVSFSSDDKYIVSSSMDHELKLWDSETGACVRTLAGHKTPIHQALFSPDDKYIFSCGRDWTVMIWRTEDGEHVETITGHLSTVYHMDVCGNKMLTSSLDDSLKLWEIKPTS